MAMLKKKEKYYILNIFFSVRNNKNYKWKKYVETYSSSNAAAQDPEERVKLNKLEYSNLK